MQAVEKDFVDNWIDAHVDDATYVLKKPVSPSSCASAAGSRPLSHQDWWTSLGSEHHMPFATYWGSTASCFQQRMGGLQLGLL